MSQQIKQLETGLGVQLFQKAGREIELTAVGERFATRVCDAFDRLHDALGDLADSQREQRLRLKVPPSIAIRWLVPRLHGFHALHPDIALEIATIALADDVRLDGADCVIRHGMGEWADVELDHLFDDEFVPVCTPALAEKFQEPQRSAAGRPAALHAAPSSLAAVARFGRPGGHSKPAGHRVGECCVAATEAAADGLGVAMAQRAYVQDDLRTGRLVVAVDHVAKTELGYYLVCDPLKAATAPVRLFRDWIRSVR